MTTYNLYFDTIVEKGKLDTGATFKTVRIGDKVLSGRFKDLSEAIELADSLLGNGINEHCSVQIHKEGSLRVEYRKSI